MVWGAQNRGDLAAACCRGVKLLRGQPPPKLFDHNCRRPQPQFDFLACARLVRALEPNFTAAGREQVSSRGGQRARPDDRSASVLTTTAVSLSPQA